MILDDDGKTNTLHTMSETVGQLLQEHGVTLYLGDKIEPGLQDRVVAGGNYGWPIREGPECQAFPDTAGLVDPQCALLPLRAPIAAYAHPSIDPRGGNAIVGGVVYRGRRWPALDGRYLFGDFVNGRVWSLMVDGAAPHRLELLADTHLQITSFAQTPDGRLYFTSMDGSLHRITVR
ncbi:MAG: ubiquitin-like domain-containing protein [Deinococcales bacterium]